MHLLSVSLLLLRICIRRSCRGKQAEILTSEMLDIHLQGAVKSLTPDYAGISLRAQYVFAAAYMCGLTRCLVAEDAR